MLLLFTVDPDERTRRGGRHVEYGVALGLGKLTAIVGPRENIFHHLLDNDLIFPLRGSIHREPMSATGTKFDGDYLRKPPMFFNPPEIQYGMARAFAYGAGKYGTWNWLGGLTLSRLAGVLRHLTQWTWEQTPDAESGLSHLDHAAAGLAMLMETAKRRIDWTTRHSTSNPLAD